MTVARPVPSPDRKHVGEMRGRMDFTGGEFWKGVFAAWVIFLSMLVMVLLAWAVLTSLLASSGTMFTTLITYSLIYLAYGLSIGGPVSAVVAMVGAPLSWLLGRLLRPIDRVWVHLLAHSLLGGVAGVVLILVATRGDLEITLGSAFSVGAVAAACMASVGGGWAWGFWRSRVRRSAPR